MARSDAITVGEAWISEHYFTTDGTKESFQAHVINRRKQWDEEKDLGTIRTRFSAKRGELLSTFATLQPGDERLPALYAEIEHILGFDRPGRELSVDGPIVHVSSLGIAGAAPLVIIHAKAVDSVEDLLAKDAGTLLEPFELDKKTTLTSVARTLSTLFTSADHPNFALVLAGGLALIAERERWAEGRFLLIDLQLVCERNDDKKNGEIDRALTCLDASSLAPDADGDVWWAVPLEESVKHTVGVSADLREGVRLSIEIIANDVVTRRRLRGAPSLPQSDAQVLARQSLRFLYRILFLLYAEASPELGVLPVGAPEYDRGYSLDRLRDLTLVELTSENAKQGTHLYESLNVLFRLVDQGHDNDAEGGDEHEGLAFRSLRADLFLPTATDLIDEVALGNEAVQQVLRHLLLSKEKKGSDRGFISYAELGINQLGAVYEGLMSYTGFFAEHDLYEVAKGGDSSKGSWVVPVTRADGIASADFVKVEDPITGELKPVIHEKGTFVYRLAGRERQQSASYYTPEVLTRFVVSQALEELLDQDGQTTTAREILDLTVCEPALGSGAFAIEAGRQLAAEYLKRRQAELGKTIDPDAYPRELQKVKAYIALHQTYGVDLNATAVELAEISLWLDTMVDGLQAPWFGLHLRRGNSLIGARRATYSRAQVTSKDWQKAVPKDVSLTGLSPDAAIDQEGSQIDGQVHHFLLPTEGWGSAVGAKEAKLAEEPVKTLKKWRSSVLSKPTKKQVDALVDLASRVEVLWQFALRRLSIAESEIRRSIDVWGADDLPTGGAVTREQIEASLADVNGAYQRLRRVMDAWCALWFWPLTDIDTTVEVGGESTNVAPPTLDQWIEACQQLLGVVTGKKPKVAGQTEIGDIDDWNLLEVVEHNDLVFASTKDVAATIAEHPWLVVCERIADRQGFFHWELDFAPMFARGGFDLQVGNPPWVRPRSDVDALLAEGDPWWQLAVKPTQEAVKKKREETLVLPGISDLVLDGTVDVACIAAFVGSSQEYPHLLGLQPDLYRCFMEQTWRHQSACGVTGLIHPESHFTEEKAGYLRAAAYRHLRRHWQFINELQLFEIHHLVTYGVHVYGSGRETPGFMMATSLYHPDTVERSRAHDGSGDEPGLKDSDGYWDMRPHRNRIIEVNDDTLTTWHAVLEDDPVPVRQSRMVYPVNRATADVLAKLSSAKRLGSLGLDFSSGWHEKNDRTKGFFDSEWGRPGSWDDVILQGPHLFVSTPCYKAPNETMLHNLDWSAIDLETLAEDAIPVTAYKPRGDRARYDASYTHWGGDANIPARSQYRIAWRRMAANTGERTLITALIPPGAAHVNAVFSARPRGASALELLRAAATASSIVSDFLIRVVPAGDIYQATFERLPELPMTALDPLLVLRAARLNTLTEAFADLWAEAFNSEFSSDTWTSQPRGSHALIGDVSPLWTSETPLRLASERRQAQLEIDALVALSLGLTADELCAIYRTQFSVLYGYDRKRYYYDANGRLVPNSVLTIWRSRQDAITVDERTATNQAGNSYTYELPFVTLDREADMRHAYAHFERILQERS